MDADLPPVTFCAMSIHQRLDRKQIRWCYTGARIYESGTSGTHLRREVPEARFR